MCGGKYELRHEAIHDKMEFDMQLQSQLKVDTHVHFHDCYDESLFLDAASRHLEIRAVDSDRIHGALCLTETIRDNWFARLTALSSGKKIGNSNWKVRATDERNSVILERSGHAKIAIFAGRQIVCAEGLEVLALGYCGEFPDKQPIRDVMMAVSAAGAIPVLPWGFGKWLGQRGRLVKDLLANRPCDFVIGDNGGRLAGVPEPGMFELVRKMHIPILPGTDPFPFPWDLDKVGRFGLSLENTLDPLVPFETFKALIHDSSIARETYGSLESLPSFIRNQIAIQLRKSRNRPQ